MFQMEVKDFETRTIRIPVFESTGAGEILHLQKSEILGAFDETGVLLLRGFSLDLKTFEAFTRNYCEKFYTVSYRHLRGQLSGDNYSNEVFQGNFMLFGHTEGTFKPYPAPPEICFFMCLTPPVEAGGETTLVDGIRFLAQLPLTIQSRFREAGVTYEMHWEPERWQQEFSIKNPDELNTLLTRLPNVKYTIHKGALHLYYKTNAVTKDRNGNEVFATAILGHLPRITHPAYLDKKVHAKPANRVYFGDGEELPDHIINELIDIHDELVYPHRWQAGDVLMIDNTRFMHGRTMTERICERIIVSRFGWLRHVT
jgi:alpha-ketoglutarate-dependent taurine dioxygenase